MFHDLKDKLKDEYTKDNLVQLETCEQLLEFEEFDSHSALTIGNLMVEMAEADIAVRIIREKDECILFQYVGDKCSQRNIDFAMKKRNTCLKTKHCSLWAMPKAILENAYIELFDADSDCLPVGGAFPIIVNQEMVATIALSGLKNGQDHQLIVDGLAKYLDKEIPRFTGKLI